MFSSMGVLWVFWLCLAACAPAAGLQTPSCIGDSGCLYQRPPALPQLDESHPRLARRPDAGPHSPEQASGTAHVTSKWTAPRFSGVRARTLPLQVHLAFAGPGAYAVTWITNPLDDAELAEAAGWEMAAAATPPTPTGAGGEPPYLAAAGPQPHLEAQAAAAEAAAEGQAGAANRHKKHHHKKKKKRRGCPHVVAAAGRSVVQYGLEPGDYRHTGEPAGSGARCCLRLPWLPRASACTERCKRVHSRHLRPTDHPLRRSACRSRGARQRGRRLLLQRVLRVGGHPPREDRGGGRGAAAAQHDSLLPLRRPRPRLERGCVWGGCECPGCWLGGAMPAWRCVPALRCRCWAAAGRWPPTHSRLICLFSLVPIPTCPPACRVQLCDCPPGGPRCAAVPPGSNW